jgi:hypothetical protein
VRRGDEEADDGEVDTKQKQRAAWGELEIPDYDEYAIFSLTQFFTTSDPVDLFEALVESLNILKIEFQVDHTKLKLKYNHIVKTEYEEDEEEETKEAEEDELRPIKLSVTVCKKEDRKYCLDFRLKEGEREAFMEHYQELVQSPELLQPYHNTKI